MPARLFPGLRASAELLRESDGGAHAEKPCAPAARGAEKAPRPTNLPPAGRRSGSREPFSLAHSDREEGPSSERARSREIGPAPTRSPLPPPLPRKGGGAKPQKSPSLGRSSSSSSLSSAAAFAHPVHASFASQLRRSSLLSGASAASRSVSPGAARLGAVSPFSRRPPSSGSARHPPSKPSVLSASTSSAHSAASSAPARDVAGRKAGAGCRGDAQPACSKSTATSSLRATRRAPEAADEDSPAGLATRSGSTSRTRDSDKEGVPGDRTLPQSSPPTVSASAGFSASGSFSALSRASPFPTLRGAASASVPPARKREEEAEGARRRGEAVRVLSPSEFAREGRAAGAERRCPVSPRRGGAEAAEMAREREAALRRRDAQDRRCGAEEGARRGLRERAQLQIPAHERTREARDRSGGTLEAGDRGREAESDESAHPLSRGRLSASGPRRSSLSGGHSSEAKTGDFETPWALGPTSPSRRRSSSASSFPSSFSSCPSLRRCGEGGAGAAEAPRSPQARGAAFASPRARSSRGGDRAAGAAAREGERLSGAAAAFHEEESFRHPAFSAAYYSPSSLRRPSFGCESSAASPTAAGRQQAQSAAARCDEGERRSAEASSHARRGEEQEAKTAGRVSSSWLEQDPLFRELTMRDARVVRELPVDLLLDDSDPLGPGAQRRQVSPRGREAETRGAAASEGHARKRAAQGMGGEADLDRHGEKERDSLLRKLQSREELTKRRLEGATIEAQREAGGRGDADHGPSASSLPRGDCLSRFGRGRGLAAPQRQTPVDWAVEEDFRELSWEARKEERRGSFSGLGGATAGIASSGSQVAPTGFHARAPSFDRQQASARVAASVGASRSSLSTPTASHSPKITASASSALRVRSRDSETKKAGGRRAFVSLLPPPARRERPLDGKPELQAASSAAGEPAAAYSRLREGSVAAPAAAKKQRGGAERSSEKRLASRHAAAPTGCLPAASAPAAGPETAAARARRCGSFEERKTGAEGGAARGLEAEGRRLQETGGEVHAGEEGQAASMIGHRSRRKMFKDSAEEGQAKMCETAGEEDDQTQLPFEKMGSQSFSPTCLACPSASRGVRTPEGAARQQLPGESEKGPETRETETTQRKVTFSPLRSWHSMCRGVLTVLLLLWRLLTSSYDSLMSQGGVDSLLTVLRDAQEDDVAEAARRREAAGKGDRNARAQTEAKGQEEIGGGRRENEGGHAEKGGSGRRDEAADTSERRGWCLYGRRWEKRGIGGEPGRASEPHEEEAGSPRAGEHTKGFTFRESFAFLFRGRARRGHQRLRAVEGEGRGDEDFTKERNPTQRGGEAREAREEGAQRPPPVAEEGLRAEETAHASGKETSCRGGDQGALSTAGFSARLSSIAILACVGGLCAAFLFGQILFSEEEAFDSEFFSDIDVM
ncbi:hypothetical protein BESB_067720 [Besnoitia besnoiti]|uniref:Uncharacterized protein n=1 Tax=Besnoitia besnoiti TaxID=94643 RepID=A0A2A9MA11_BESBE|nr:hypothetical protein BESB_067720 [Besnoitia besnoiti]PFH34739.1 hypothetical protein BESB_067720 [Besnoitia besnoiti]